MAPTSKSKHKKTFEELARLTLVKCRTCPTEEKYRCCDAVFCQLVRTQMGSRAKLYQFDKDAEVPYMGANGCRVHPSDRPFCAGYVCSQHLGDAKFKSEYTRLCDAVGIPPALKNYLPFQAWANRIANVIPKVLKSKSCQSVPMEKESEISFNKPTPTDNSIPS